MNPIPVLMVTYNRLAYSKRALYSIWNKPGLAVEVNVWDNASTDGTPEWMRNSDVHDFHYSPKNVGLAPAMNWFFRKYADAPYVVKVDNDTVLPDNWLADLMKAMTFLREKTQKVGAVSGTAWRPYGDTAEEWFSRMPSMVCHPYPEAFNAQHKLYFHTYVFGTGVLINMDLIREKGLLFERFPRSPSSGLDDPCLISGWTAYTREAAEYENWKFAMYSKVWMRLLNLKAEHIPSGEYPWYDAEIARVREEGNAWWNSVGGMPGVRKFVQDHGGYAPLKPSMRNETGLCAMKEEPTSVWTEADDLKARSTQEWWIKRVDEVGTSRSTFLSTPQARINEFTERHIEVLKQYLPGKDVLDVGCGWSRMSFDISKMAKSYVGVDFVPALVEKAKESLPQLDFRVADATKLPFADESFDVITAITCLSSFAAILPEVLTELKRVLRPDGRILFLEQDYARIDWKMKNA